jgi:hypothetical protein
MAPMWPSDALQSRTKRRRSGDDPASNAEGDSEADERNPPPAGPHRLGFRRELGASDLATVRSNAAKVAQLSQQASGWFPAGTGPDVAKTGAKPEIWQTPDDFAAKLHNFQAAAQAFNATARGNDLAAINAKFGELGQACKACHDKYRAEMHH